MTAAVTLEGTAGRAVRLDLRDAPPPYGEAIVDDWTLHPDVGPRWSLLAAQKEGAYLLCLARVDPLRAVVGRLLHRPATWGVDFALALPIEPDSPTHAREITRAMAKVWAGGGLPLPVITPRQHDSWALMTALLESATRPLASERA